MSDVLPQLKQRVASEAKPQTVSKSNRHVSVAYLQNVS